MMGVLRQSTMRIITATEFRKNLSKYLKLSLSEDILVTRNGKILTMLTNPNKREDSFDRFLSLRGCLPPVDYEKALHERDMNR